MHSHSQKLKISTSFGTILSSNPIHLDSPISTNDCKLINKCKNCSYSFHIQMSSTDFCTKDCETCFILTHNDPNKYSNSSNNNRNESNTNDIHDIKEIQEHNTSCNHDSNDIKLLNNKHQYVVIDDCIMKKR